MSKNYYNSEKNVFGRRQNIAQNFTVYHPLLEKCLQLKL